MSTWPSTKAKRVYAALVRLGWTYIRQVGSHRVLRREGFDDYTFAYHDSDELGPRILAKIGKKTGLTPEDL